MDQSKNSFAPVVQDDRAARALILSASRKILDLRKAHEEAMAAGTREAKDASNAERAELKQIFEKLQSFEPDPAKPLSARSLENLDATRKEVEVTLINYETYADDEGNGPEDTELDEVIRRLSTTNTRNNDDEKDDDDNKTKDKVVVVSSSRVLHSTEKKKQNVESVNVATPEPALPTALFSVSEAQPTLDAKSNGGKSSLGKQDTASRGTRRSRGKTTSVASSKREAEKEKNDIKIRFLEEQAVLEAQVQRMEFEMKMQVESAKHRLKVETLKAEAKRDNELARVDEEPETSEDDYEEDEEDRVSHAETVDRWVESTVSQKEERVSHGSRQDEGKQTDALTHDQRFHEQTTSRPQNRETRPVLHCEQVTVSPIPGHVEQNPCPPSPRPPESAKFFDNKPFFARNEESEALQTFIFRLETVYQRAIETGRTVTFNTPEIYNTILHRKLSSLLNRWAVEVVKHDNKFTKSGNPVPDISFDDFIEFLKMQHKITAYRDAMDGEKAQVTPRGNPRFNTRNNDRMTTTKLAATDIHDDEASTETYADIAATAADNGTTRPSLSSQNRGRPLTRVSPNHNPVPGQKDGSRRFDETRKRDPAVCRLCKASDGHKLAKCPAFLASQDRLSDCWKTGHCFNCLEHGHVAAKCPRDPGCSKCKGNHHDLIHRDPPEAESGGPSSQ